ncbi:Uncharacterised protein [Chlamydia abortus]|nr:Uncharacterised protein [Chlamydia abortus]
MNLFKFWDENYRIEDDTLRVMVAQAITDEYEARGRRSELFTKKYRHPMIRLKNYLTRYSILDILGDFIIKSKQKTEKEKSHPVRNAEAQWDYDNKWKKRSTKLDSVHRHLALCGGLFGLERSRRSRQAKVTVKMLDDPKKYENVTIL